MQTFPRSQTGLRQLFFSCGLGSRGRCRRLRCQNRFIHVCSPHRQNSEAAPTGGSRRADGTVFAQPSLPGTEKRRPAPGQNIRIRRFLPGLPSEDTTLIIYYSILKAGVQEEFNAFFESFYEACKKRLTDFVKSCIMSVTKSDGEGDWACSVWRARLRCAHRGCTGKWAFRRLQDSPMPCGGRTEPTRQSCICGRC